ncbi:zf-HC2 domain-containing protein [Microbulbifer sp. Q7]|uniref:zf-HC2 domain-containing protein n=1 Tax=Microbulbifer sp. Q7 TaxID=1785091 RepID=UPI000AA47318|nr:zf-HC2 domain-containing protein [Microbulbifer sp. Q7]
MNCKQATQLLSLQQERPLSRREKFSLRFHLMLCKACRNFSTQMDSLRTISRRYAKGEPPASDDRESH